MTTEGPRHLQGHGLLVLGPAEVEAVDYWLVVRDEEGGGVTTSGWIVGRYPVLEELWRTRRLVTLVLNDRRTLHVELTSEFGACTAKEPPA